MTTALKSSWTLRPFLLRRTYEDLDSNPFSIGPFPTPFLPVGLRLEGSRIPMMKVDRFPQLALWSRILFSPNSSCFSILLRSGLQDAVQTSLSWKYGTRQMIITG